jgi:peptide/nickel transport system permease protein
VVFFSWIISIPLGILGAVFYNSLFDKFLTLITSFGMALPSFFFAILMLLFAQHTGWFPIGGLTSIHFSDLSFTNKILDIAWHLVLPVFVLTCISLSSMMRQMRANLLDVLNSEYIKFAMAKGLSYRKVIIKHALRNAINPIITLLGFEFAGLLSGAALTEYVFQYPGLGKLILEAVMQSDINLIMASLVMGTFMLILGNIIADILLKITDPRVGV